jgi:hypothetical protein
LSRGRLIFPFLSEIHRVDPRALARDPGLDGDFKEPALVDRDDDGVPDRAPPEHPPVRVPCQVEPKSDEALRMFASGNAPRMHVELVFHFEDLERLGLVDENGEALIRAGDRLGALFTTRGELVWRVPRPPGLFVTEVSPLGFGLPHRAPRRNLLLVVFEDRSLGAPRGGA